MKQVRKETRERRKYQLCKERGERLLFEKKVLKRIVAGLQRGLSHCKYLSGQLNQEMYNLDIALCYRSSNIQAIQASVSNQQSGIRPPLVDYEFDLLEEGLRRTMADWIGSHSYFVYMLVSKHFRLVLKKLCPLSHDPQRSRLQVGDCVSSLAITASKSKQRHICKSLKSYTTGQESVSYANWLAPTVHVFRVLAGPPEMRSLHASRPLSNNTWLLVPHLPWKQLFHIFQIEKTGSFLSKRRKLKRILINNISSLSVSCREQLWRF
jgi:hypothetical protein